MSIKIDDEGRGLRITINEVGLVRQRYFAENADEAARAVEHYFRGGVDKHLGETQTCPLCRAMAEDKRKAERA